jgi:transcriptional regulator with XRE-family HTH domain
MRETPDALRSALETFFARMQHERGLSRRRICGLAQVSESTVREFLAGKYRSMQLDTLEKLARAVGSSVEQILGPNGSAGSGPPPDIDHLHALLSAVLAFLKKHKIALPPRDFADLFVALYGVAPQAPAGPYKITPPLARLIRLYADRRPAGRRARG